MIVDYRVYVTVATLAYVGMVGSIPLRKYSVFNPALGVLIATALVAFLDWLWS